MENLSVLIIEDDETIRKLFRRVLLQRVNIVKTAEDGNKGIELIGDTYFDIIITDFLMPGLCGTELIQQVRELSPGSKVISMSGYTQGVTAAKIKRAGANLFLEKPISPPTLVNAIKNLQ